MNLLIIGSKGQLGRDMVTLCSEAGYAVKGCDYPDIDITRQDSTDAVVQHYNPGCIINCAAYTAVDECETNLETAFNVNAEGVANIARSALKIDAAVVHISTDYVFDGRKDGPYIESDPTNPQSVYGKSKLLGEQKLGALMQKYFIFRIAWLYGTHGNNFVKTIRSVALQRKTDGKPLLVVNDQIGTPTYTRSVCRQIMPLISTSRFGLYHCTCEGSCSWFDFAVHILKNASIDIEVLPCTTEQFPRPAPRPRNSVLENYNLKVHGLNNLPAWKDSYSQFLSDESSLEK